MVVRFSRSESSKDLFWEDEQDGCHGLWARRREGREAGADSHASSALGAWGASLLSVPRTGLSETLEPAVGRLSQVKWQTKAGAGRAQPARLLDLLLCRPGSTLSLSFLMSCDLAQHIRRRPVGEDWAGGGGQWTEPCLLTPPSSNRSLHVCVCVGVHPGPHEELGVEQST